MMTEAELKALASKWIADLIRHKATDQDTMWLISTILGTAFINWNVPESGIIDLMTQLTSDVFATMKNATDTYISDKGVHEAAPETKTRH